MSKQKRWYKRGYEENGKKLETMKKKYCKNDKFNAIVDCVDDTIYAKNCP